MWWLSIFIEGSFFFKLSIYGCAGSCCWTAFSLVAASRGGALAMVCRLLTAVASFAARALTLGRVGSAVGDPGLGSTGSVEAMGLSCSVASSWIRDWTRVSCIDRQISYHWTPGEVREKLWIHISERCGCQGDRGEELCGWGGCGRSSTTSSIWTGPLLS